MELERTDLDWPQAAGMVLVVTDGAGYREAVQATASLLTQRCDGGVVVTANRPAPLLRDSLKGAGVDLTDVVFVDAISAMTGMPPAPEPDVHHVESPTMLEKMTLRAERALRGVAGRRRFLLLDSLSTLAMYNGVPAVTEFTHNLATRLRLLGVEGALLLVENVGQADLRDAVQPLFDGVVEA